MRLEGTAGCWWVLREIIGGCWHHRGMEALQQAREHCRGLGDTVGGWRTQSTAEAEGSQRTWEHCKRLGALWELRGLRRPGSTATTFGNCRRLMGSAGHTLELGKITGDWRLCSKVVSTAAGWVALWEVRILRRPGITVRLGAL